MKTNLLHANAAINVFVCTAAQNNYCSPSFGERRAPYSTTHTYSLYNKNHIDNKTMLLLMFIFFRDIGIQRGILPYVCCVCLRIVIVISPIFYYYCYYFIYIFIIIIFFLSRFVWYRFLIGHYNIIPLCPMRARTGSGLRRTYIPAAASIRILILIISSVTTCAVAEYNLRII